MFVNMSVSLIFLTRSMPYMPFLTSTALICNVSMLQQIRV